ncbi:hypothetical protein I6N90_01660 [Paenibacillus sp. GSMTC-2017]|uniref:hypothetical protein n=1 Tax=Paenibacillus sp. GSMTC-2017 TaxID=2794350 RepID=UPI0018D6FD57|nr:hypothetical protein [Paenibacillus sp. GSMTC-2017]MBH5316511.1 hypothetical protein [Paenibacillus sp. GSMTC-2017]
MYKVSKLMFYYGLYIIILGASLLFTPKVVQPILQFNDDSTVWIQFFGMILLCIGFYYVRSGLDNNVHFAKSTVFGRIFVCIVAIVLTIKYELPINFIVIGVLDFLSAVVTMYLLPKSIEKNSRSNIEC